MPEAYPASSLRVTSGAGAFERLRNARRIVIIGSSGAGKTHLALRLGELLALPLVHLDVHRWKPGWISRPDREWRTAVAALTNEPAWIMDGTYESTLALRLAAAEAVIVLERPRLLCLVGILRRRASIRAKPRVDAPPGQRLDRAFLWYVWRYPSATRPVMLEQLREHGAGKTVIVLRGRRAADRLVQNVRRGGARGADS